MTLSRALAIAAALAILAGPAAHAFTIDNKSNTNSNGAARYTDPDEQFSGSNSSPGSTKYKSGNTTLQFGSPQSFEQRYDSNRLFDPLARDR